VDGTEYRWAIRRKPSYGQAIEESNLTAAVELFDNPDATLVLTFPSKRPDSWITPGGLSITPSVITRCIRRSIEIGWDATAHGATFNMKVAPEDIV
jgi:hypothetical protein